MSNHTSGWAAFRKRELTEAIPLLRQLGFALDSEQRHIIGERELLMNTHDVGGGGYKLVLTGKKVSDGMRVIIKVTSDPSGIAEIERERKARDTITKLRFSYSIFTPPQEILHTTQGGHLISVTEFIEQEMPFLERPIQDQSTLALRALKIQEGVHATTYSHTKTIQSVFGSVGSEYYIRTARAYVESMRESSLINHTDIRDALHHLETQTECIEQYCGFLTHADFVPHNLRIRGDTIYLLDYASIHFGNKYESWARFLNFMTLHNRPLEKALTAYVAQNRTTEEQTSLQAMRIFKSLFLVYFYSQNVSNSTGNLQALTEARIRFWNDVLRTQLQAKEIPESVIDAYRQTRDTLRSDEEKLRQKELH